MHEAGHAVLFIEGGIGVDSIRLTGDGLSGECEPKEGFRSGEVVSWFEPYIIALFGGMAAELRLYKEHGRDQQAALVERNHAWQSDREKARDALGRQLNTGIDAECERLAYMATERINGDKVWAGVRRIAEALVGQIKSEFEECPADAIRKEHWMREPRIRQLYQSVATQP